MRGIGEGKENLSEEGGNTPTALLPLPNLPARLASPLLPLQSLSCLSNSPWRFCLLKKKAPFLCLCGKGAFYWLGLFFLRMLHSFTGNPFADFFELCTVQSVILKGEPALYLSTLPKRGKARNRDSIRSKVLGRGGMGDADLFAYALVKLCSKLLFQLLHLHSNGGLGISQKLCGFGKTLGLSYFGKCDQVSNFHEVLSLYRN